MPSSQFWRLLGGTTIITGLVLYLMHLIIPQQSAFLPFSGMSILLFFVLSIFAFYIGKLAATSINKYRFVQVIIFFIIIKMATSIMLVIGYWKWYQPSSNGFIIPFLIVYLVYTIFEIHFLEKLARLEPVN